MTSANGGAPGPEAGSAEGPVAVLEVLAADADVVLAAEDDDVMLFISFDTLERKFLKNDDDGVEGAAQPVERLVVLLEQVGRRA